MRISVLLPLVLLGLAGCVSVHDHPNPTPTATVVQPAGADHDLRHPGSADLDDRRAHALNGAARFA